MNPKPIDLHVHSTCSDGTCTPTELVALAKEAGLAAIALTDHDSISGISEAILAAKDTGLEIVPGVELSCDFCGSEVHMLGLYIHPDDPVLSAKLEEFKRIRESRNERMVELLAAEGLDITYEKLLADNPDSVITRGNIAGYLVEHGCVKDRATVFAKYLGDDCRCFVPRPKISPEEAIALIHQAGGLAFLAHPLLYHMNLEALRELLTGLKAHGLNGLEAVYSTYQPGDERNMKVLAAELNLLISGGSDFHGSNKPHIRLGTGMGRLYVPYEILAAIQAAKAGSVI